MALLAKTAKENTDLLYFIFRVLVGFLFLSHGLQKLGLLDGETFQIEGFIGFVGVCELAGGLAIFFGLWTRLVAVLGTILMVGAYVTAHAGQGILPILNKGEMALLYVAAFLVLFILGAGKWSVEKAFLGKESF